MCWMCCEPGEWNRMRFARSCPTARWFAARDILEHWKIFESGERRFQISVVPYRGVYPHWAVVADDEQIGRWLLGDERYLVRSQESPAEHSVRPVRSGGRGLQISLRKTLSMDRHFILLRWMQTAESTLTKSKICNWRNCWFAAYRTRRSVPRTGITPLSHRVEKWLNKCFAPSQRGEEVSVLREKICAISEECRLSLIPSTLRGRVGYSIAFMSVLRMRKSLTSPELTAPVFRS